MDTSQKRDDTFIEAWENGLRTFDENRQTSKIIPVRREQKNYPPAHPPTSMPQPTIEDFQPITEKLRKNLENIVQWQRQHKEQEAKKINTSAGDERIEFIIHSAIEFAQREELANVREKLEEADALDKSNQFYEIENNLGNLLRAEGKFEEALVKYEEAYALAPNDNGILWNLVVTHIGLGQKAKAARRLWALRQKPGVNIYEASRQLGISTEPSEDYESETKILEMKLHALIEKVQNAKTIEDLSLEDVNLSERELSNTTSGIYWKSTEN